MRKSAQRKKWTTRKTFLGADEGSFDAKFWKKLEPSKRLEEVCRLTDEVLRFKGIDPSKLRMDKTVGKVIRLRTT